MKIFKNFKSHFEFTRSEQSGILLLSLSIVLVWLIQWGIREREELVFDMQSKAVIDFQKEMDSLHQTAIENRKPKLYPFNPNFISDYKGYELGLTPEQIDSLHEFRDQGNWIRSASEFQKITRVSDTWLDSIAPFFKFPHWNNTKRKREKVFKKQSFSYSEKIDLNVVTQRELMQVRGIGEVFSKRILEYRNRLGGFSDDAQLYFVYGINKETVNELLLRFTVKTPKPIAKRNINQLSASDLSTLPGISFEMAVRIWQFVRSKNGIESLEELQKIDEITPQKIALIKLYLSAE